jgi:hypothetical protein
VTPVTARRTIFGAAALLALATPARATERNPDAELIALCANYSDLARRHDAFFDHSKGETAAEEDVREAAQGPLYSAMLATVERIEALPPVVTFEGARAIVRAVAIWDKDHLDGFNLSNTSLDLMTVLFESLAGDVA